MFLIKPNQRILKYSKTFYYEISNGIYFTLSPEYLIDLYHHIPTVVGRAIIKTNA